MPDDTKLFYRWALYKSNVNIEQRGNFIHIFIYNGPWNEGIFRIDEEDIRWSRRGKTNSEKT